MAGYLLPSLFGLFAWWFATGLVLGIVGLGRAWRPLIAAGCVAATVAGLAALVLTRNDVGLAGAYLAFAAALLVWGAQETAFLLGWITGPFRAACPPGLGLAARAGYATRAIIHHELALAASGLAIAAATFAGVNQTGPWTFALLFVLRLSAKLNVFLGVPNITEGFLPREVAHLKSFFARRPMNPLFPLSVTVATVAAVLLVDRAWSAEDEAAAARATLLAALLGLGLLEHWFLVLPLPVEALWGFAGRPEQVAAAEPVPAVAANVIHLAAVAAARSGVVADQVVAKPSPVTRAGDPVAASKPDHVWRTS